MPVKREKGKEQEADEEAARDLLARPAGETLLLKRSDWERLKPRLNDRFVPLPRLRIGWRAKRSRRGPLVRGQTTDPIAIGLTLQQRFRRLCPPWNS